MIFTCSLPLAIHTTKSKTPKSKFILNLNNYRNTHFTKLNNAKVCYKEEIKEFVYGNKIDVKDGVKIEYTLWAGSNRPMDISNVCSIVDKFFCDVMTEYGNWDDDNYNVVKEVVYRWGGVDKDSPRVDVCIYNL